MQATATTRRFDPRKVKQAALAVGLLTSLAIGGTVVSIVRDSSDASSSTATQIRTASVVHELGSYQFREQNQYLPGYTSQPAALSYDAIRFREMNELPNSIAPAAPNWQILEMNSWGEDFTFTITGDDGRAPSPDDAPQKLSGQVRY